SQLSDRHRFTLFTIRHRLLERCEEIIAEHETLTRHLRSGDAAAFADTLRGHIAENAPASTPARDTGGFLELCVPGRRHSGRALQPGGSGRVRARSSGRAGGFGRAGGGPGVPTSPGVPTNPGGSGRAPTGGSGAAGTVVG